MASTFVGNEAVGRAERRDRLRCRRIDDGIVGLLVVGLHGDDGRRLRGIDARLALATAGRQLLRHLRLHLRVRVINRLFINYEPNEKKL